MNHTEMNPHQTLEEFRCIMDSCRGRLNTKKSSKGPTDRQHKDIYYKSCRQITMVNGKPILKGVTSFLPTFDEVWWSSVWITSPVGASPQKVAQGPTLL